MSFLDYLRSKNPKTPEANPVQGQWQDEKPALQAAPEGGQQVVSPTQDPNSPYFLTDSKRRELVSYVDSEYKRRQDERRSFEAIWKLNINFLEGNQYCDINPVTLAIEDVPLLTTWQEREPFNHIAPNCETRLARLGKMRPVLTTAPGPDDEDAYTAKVSKALLKETYHNTGTKSQQNEANSWSEATGTVVFKDTWNPNAGRIIGYDQEGNAVHEGDIETTICPPQEIFPDSSYHHDIVDCFDILHAKAYAVQEIEDTWGVKVTADGLSVVQLVRSMIGVGGLGYGLMGGYSFNSVKLPNHALVKELWERPSKKYPQGRLIITAGGQLLYFGPLPYKIGKDSEYDLPFTKQVCIDRQGVFWGRSIIERLIPVQRRYNALRNRKAEFLNRCAIGVWIVEENSTDLEYLEENGGAPGSVITYRQGSAPPHMADNPSLPAAFETELQALLQEFSILSGVSEISRQSQAPAGVKSGVAISLALEQDDTRLSSTVDNIGNALTRRGAIWLRLYKQYAKGYRVMNAVGKNNVVEVLQWTGSDLRADEVILEPYSAMADSLAQRRAMIFDLIESGLMVDPDTGQINKDTRNKILEIIELGHWESIDNDDELHIQRAERENLALKQGQPTSPPVDYDDHIIHIHHHNHFRLTVEYEQLAAQSEEVATAFEQHINFHLMLMQQAAMRQAAQAAQVVPIDRGAQQTA